MERVAVPVVDVVDVVAVGDGFVSAVGAMYVVVILMGHVFGRHTLVPVPVVLAMGMAVVDVVDVVAVGDGLMAAVGSVGMSVVFMRRARGCHGAFLLFERDRERRSRCG